MAIYRGSGTTGTATQAYNLDGDKGDITVTNEGGTWTIDAGVVTTTKLGGDVTPQGKALLDDATAADQRTTLGLGSAAITNANDYATSTQGIKADSALQPSDIGVLTQVYDSNLTSFVNTFTLPTIDGTTGQSLVTNGSGSLSFTSGGTGSVTNVSVVSANGLAGTVANSTTTPAITLSTSVTGLLKGNGASISAAGAGTDYLSPAAINTTVQAYSANLDEYAAVNPTAAGLALLDDVDASAQRTTLGLGVLAIAGDGDKGDIVVSSSGTSWQIDSNVIVNADVNASAAIESSKLQFTPSGTGAVARTVQSKLRDRVSVTDFGAVGDGVTNNLTAITNAISGASGKTIFVPIDTSGGNYAITSGTLTIPASTKFEYEGNARIYASGGSITDNGNHISILGAGNSGTTVSAGRGIVMDLSNISGTASNSTLGINRIVIKDDSLDASPDSNGTKVDGLFLLHNFGGALAQGGRHALEATLIQQDITSSSNPDRNYVGIAGVSSSAVGDGGTDLSTGKKGAYFGINGYCSLESGATNVNNASAGEFNCNVATGASLSYRSGIQVASGGAVNGSTWDAGVSISSYQTGSTARWKDAILIGNQNGRYAIETTGNAIRILSDVTIANLIDATGIICSGSVLKASGIDIKNTGATFDASGFVIDIGSNTASNVPRIDFHSSGVSLDYDARIRADGGGALGTGNLAFDASGGSRFSGTVRPQVDNTTTLGTATFRWSVVYAGTGTINTSDIREKQQIRSLSDSEKAVAIKLKGMIKAFKFNDAVKTKGDKARIHFGVIAQEVKAAFESEGLIAENYAILCYDEWEEVPELLNGEGKIMEEYKAAGNRYGIRYDELLAFIIGAI